MPICTSVLKGIGSKKWISLLPCQCAISVLAKEPNKLEEYQLGYNDYSFVARCCELKIIKSNIIINMAQMLPTITSFDLR
ncbi:hypothetical protein K1719_042346 [Acacia pycnantha]|nr:hypothetical protein K1719_042346 [Acacia pycnantha]